MVVRVRGEDTLSKPESSDEEEEEEGEVTPPPPSPLRETLPSFGDILSRQAGVAVGMRQLKQTRIEIGSSADLPPQPHLALVSPNSWGSSVMPNGTNSPIRDFACPIVLVGHHGEGAVPAMEGSMAAFC
jgi:hypothetical protein